MREWCNSSIINATPAWESPDGEMWMNLELLTGRNNPKDADLI